MPQLNSRQIADRNKLMGELNPEEIPVILVKGGEGFTIHKITKHSELNYWICENHETGHSFTVAEDNPYWYV